jgi:hypothetical protein
MLEHNMRVKLLLIYIQPIIHTKGYVAYTYQDNTSLVILGNYTKHYFACNFGRNIVTVSTFDGLTYYLNKCETLNFQSNQFTAHMTRCHYHVGQRDISNLEYALVDRDANGGIGGSTMKAL